MIKLVKWLLRSMLGLLYRVEVRGLQNYYEAGDRVVIISNHTSFLDAVLLVLFMPDRLTFAINTHVAKFWWVRPFGALVNLFPMDPANPLSTKALIRHVKEDRKAVIFPEGRITVTGALMKVYQGPGLVADKSGAMLLPVRIDGAQYTPFSRLRGRVRLRWFPRITLTILPPRTLDIPDHLVGRARRTRAGTALSELMSGMIFATANRDSTLFQAILEARRLHGGKHPVVNDIQRSPVTYNQLLMRACILGGVIARDTAPGEYVGVLLPNMISSVVTFLGLQLHGRVPAMMNYTVGASGMISAVQTARIRHILTSRRFVTMARLDDAVARLAEHVRIVYLEDLRDCIGPWRVATGYLASRFPGWTYRRTARGVRPDDPAVVLFTSGSEGTPKGVVLSHRNLLSNRDQLVSKVDFTGQDVILNALPMFHSFGLSAGTLLPLISGMKVFFYPSPLHYRIIPEVAYEVNATILFGTNTFLAGYARFAHPYDFYSVRYVFAGAERVQEQTRRIWMEKFGIRIFEGYGATETSPGLATNTAMDFRAGSVGRLLPGIEARLIPVPGIEEGGRLMVRGPNIMLGYLLADKPGELQPPVTECGAGWYDTGDIVTIDDDGFVWIKGRAKRFAKVGGEMVSLTVAEQLAAKVWPDSLHAVVALPDPVKGEQLVLLTQQRDAERHAMQQRARADGIGEIAVPKHILVTQAIPLLGSGKTDYTAARDLAEHELAGLSPEVDEDEAQIEDES